MEKSKKTCEIVLYQYDYRFSNVSDEIYKLSEENILIELKLNVIREEYYPTCITPQQL